MLDGVDTNPYVLSDKESNLVREIFKCYEPEGKRLGLSKIFEQINSYLLTAYFKNPVKRGSKALPAFKIPGLSQKEKEAYYKHIHHTAGRYLTSLRNRPNEWICPNVELARSVPGGKTACLYEKSKRLIALLWLMANDDKRSQLPRANRLEAFAAVIADVARAKNWAQTRFNEFGRCEEYDNMGPDLPVCATGVDKRLVKLAYNIQHDFAAEPALRDLNEMILLHSFYERTVNPYIKEYLKDLSLDQCIILQQGIRNKFLLEDISEEQYILMWRFRIDPGTMDGWGRIDSFIEWAENFFTTERIKMKRAYSWHGKTYPDASTLIYREFSQNLWSHYFEQLDSILTTEIKDRQTQNNGYELCVDDEVAPFILIDEPIRRSRFLH